MGPRRPGRKRWTHQPRQHRAEMLAPPLGQDPTRPRGRQAFEQTQEERTRAVRRRRDQRAELRARARRPTCPLATLDRRALHPAAPAISAELAMSPALWA